MANFLIDGVKTMVTTAIVKKAAGLFGIENNRLTSSIGKFLPIIIGALISKGRTSSGAGGILDLIKGGGYGDNSNNDLEGIFSSKSSSDDFLSKGADLLPAIFGSRQSGIMDKVISMSGLGKGAAGTVMKFLLPIVMGKLGSVVSGKNLNAQGLSSYLQDQKSSIANMGIGNMFDDEATSSASAAVSKSNSGGGGLMKFLLPLLLLLGALYFLTRNGCNSGDTATIGDTTEQTTTAHEGHDHSDHAGHDHSGHEGHDHGTKTVTTTGAGSTITSGGGGINYTLNDKGDLVGADGKVISMANSWSLNNDGSIIDLAGNKIAAAGSYSKSFLGTLKEKFGKLSGTSYGIDKDKNIVDAKGNILYKYGEYIEKDNFFVDKNGNKIGARLSKFSINVLDKLENAGEKIGEAFDDAGKELGEKADVAVAKFQTLFSNMVTKKEGSNSNYTLSDIVFDKENNRITNFSKAEVEGLASALKANPTGKIVVRNYTSDGGDDKENKKLSKTRAQVVHDMLVTLGVSNKQISFKGLGSEDAAKAKANKVEISVE